MLSKSAPLKKLKSKSKSKSNFYKIVKSKSKSGTSNPNPQIRIWKSGDELLQMLSCIFNESTHIRHAHYALYM